MFKEKRKFKLSLNFFHFQILTLTFTAIFIFGIPLGISSQRPVDPEYEEAMKKAWNKKFEGKWWAQWK
jgi:hypothetical protein